MVNNIKPKHQVRIKVVSVSKLVSCVTFIFYMLSGDAFCLLIG